MTIKPEVLDAMLAAGCSAEQIVAAVKADLASQWAEEQAREDKEAERREMDRQRKRREREQKKQAKTIAASEVSGGQSRTAADIADTPSPDKETPPTPPKENNPNPIPPSPPKGGSSPIDSAFAAFEAMAERSGIPKPRVLSEQRRRKMAGLIRTHGLPAVEEAIAAIGASPFCRGENDRGWVADLDFLFQPKSFARLLEGGYGGRKAGAPSGPESPTDPNLVSLPPDHPDFRAVERLRGKAVPVGNSGRATFTKAEIEQARRQLEEAPF